MLNLFKYNISKLSNNSSKSLSLIGNFNNVTSPYSFIKQQSFNTTTTTTLLFANNNNKCFNDNVDFKFYTKANHKYTRRASYTHQQDIKSLKKREEKKEASQQHREPTEFPHNKKAHEHTKPLSHQDKLDLKKKLKARRKKEIKDDNAERVKHIMEAEDESAQEIKSASSTSSHRNASTSSLLNAAASSVSIEKGEEVLAALSNSNQRRVNNIQLEDDDEDDQHHQEDIDDDNEEDLIYQDEDEEFEEDEDNEDNELDEIDEDEDEDDEEGDYRDQYEDDDADLEEYEDDGEPEFDLDSIDPSKIIEVDAEMLKDLPVDDDGQIVLPNFISFEDAKSKYGFTERELKDSAFSYAAAEAARQMEAEKAQGEDKKGAPKKSKKSTKQLEREAKTAAQLPKVEEVEEEEEEVEDSETTRKKQQKLDKSLRKQVSQVKESKKEEFENIDHFIRDKHLQKLQSARGGQIGMQPIVKGPPKVAEIMEVLAETKLEDFCVIDVSDKCKWTKYMIVASSDSNRVILNAEEDLLEKFQNRLSKGHQPRNPTDDSDVWRVLDLEECLVHLFETSTREYYDLETLWVTRRPAGSEEQSWDDEKTDMIAERHSNPKND
ncbi:hypothetical protein PPL_01088 [Heterostelium album PN500]|uniref:Uncharacterized protein n=1 Tax=Heterostelium pallidum (strain ATCC 26659 / Pp 5 / PN500) TaxID=670386 RepID=D3AY29_HETP5|nr:hypothetical protein PPL_01088 [Heterostelium album PN500]EFA85856.1 hypothetical protein PPL_01088 [Heterostelium album PN500]|eukprot:XP_020437962.1 hypothetical protein PPL_01088 [Heterostelium album PN500]